MLKKQLSPLPDLSFIAQDMRAGPESFAPGKTPDAWFSCAVC
jgi:hypothetical protein